MIIIGGSTGRLSSTLLVTLLLGGCYYSSHINPDAAQRTNASLERDEGGTNVNPDYPHDAVIRLWSDKPEYAVLANAKHVKEMRVISAVSPDYPYWLHLAHVRGSIRRQSRQYENLLGFQRKEPLVRSVKWLLFRSILGHLRRAPDRAEE